jgi:hypothetical protein
MAYPPIQLDRPISWVCEPYTTPEGKKEVRVIRPGMSREELHAAFPPKRPGPDYDRKGLIKAIIFEAYREVVENGYQRQEKNIRGFWYERLLYAILRVMGEAGTPHNIKSIRTTINAAWKELVEDGWLTYEDLNLYSEKEGKNYYIGIRPDSPYPTAILMVEKASLIGLLRDLADTFEINFVATEGQNSRAAAMAFAHTLERRGIDLAQPFTVYSFADYDPQGWCIPIQFIQHLSLRVTGPIRLVRLGLCREQLGDSLIERAAVPYVIEGEDPASRKRARTLYQRFTEETGGLFIPDSRGRLVPAKVELDALEGLIRDDIIDGLAAHLDGFEYQVRRLESYVRDDGYQRAWDGLCDWIRSEAARAYDSTHHALRAQGAAIDRAIAKRTYLEQEAIADLEEEIAALQELIEEKTEDLRSDREELESEQNAMRVRQTREADAAIERLQENGGLPTPEDLLSEIADNGGWRDWLEGLGLAAVGSERLASDARAHRRFSWTLAYPDKEKIRAWLKARLVDAAPDCQIRGPWGG